MNVKVPPALILAMMVPLCGGLKADTFDFSGTVPGTYNWSDGSGWNAVPVSDPSAVLTIFNPNATVLQTGTVALVNNLGNFELNQLNLQGTGPSVSGTAAVVFSGSALSFVSAGGTNPSINFNANNATGAVAYTIANNVAFSDPVTFAGNGTGSFALSGILSGSGDLIKGGTHNLLISGAANTSRLYTGDIVMNAGRLQVANGAPLYTRGDLIMNGGTVNLAGTAASALSVMSFSGTGGTIAAGRIVVNTADPATRSFSGNFSGGAGTTGASLYYLGAGKLELPAFNGSNFSTLTYSSAVGGVGTLQTVGFGQLSQPPAAIYGRGNMIITGTSIGGANVILGRGSDTLTLYGGRLVVAPTGSNSNVSVAGFSNSQVTNRIATAGGASIELDKGDNTSLKLFLGASDGTRTEKFFTRSNAGTLVIKPGSGLASFGTAAGESLIVRSPAGGASLPFVGGGLASYWIVGEDADGRGGFLTYVGTGTTTDVGFQVASYSGTAFAGASGTSALKITSSQSVASSVSISALRNDSVITINSGQTLTIDGYDTRSGLILNGGQIQGPGALSFVNREGLIYTGSAGGVISSSIAGSGAAVSGGISGNVSITKFGEGTLVLSGNNTYTGQTVINQGALRVTSNLPSSALVLRGGVLEMSGTFNRAVGATNTSNVVNFGAGDNPGGGFSAHGGALAVNLGGAAATLTWGSANFIGDYGLLSFNSRTANNVVNWQNGLNLGATSAAYYRQIYVEDNTDSAADYAVISGVITDAGNEGLHGLQKVGPGTLVLSANNTYSGITAVSSGSLVLGNGGSSGSVAGDIENYATLAFNRSDASSYAGEISKSGQVVQMGSGTQTLTGANLYSGGTEVNAGTLLISNAAGSGAGTGDVSVNSGGTLGGTGAFSGAVTVNSGGVLSPGASIETLGSGSVNFNNGATFAYEVDSSAALSVAADLQKVTGDLNLSGAVVLTLDDLAGSPLAFAENTTFTLINYTGSWNGGFFTYGGDVIADGGVFLAGLNAWRLDYDSSAGGSNFSGEYLGGSYVNITAVPEPGTLTLAAAGALVLLILIRRQKSQPNASGNPSV